MRDSHQTLFFVQAVINYQQCHYYGIGSVKSLFSPISVNNHWISKYVLCGAGRHNVAYTSLKHGLGVTTIPFPLGNSDFAKVPLIFFSTFIFSSSHYSYPIATPGKYECGSQQVTRSWQPCHCCPDYPFSHSCRTNNHSGLLLFCDPSNAFQLAQKQQNDKWLSNHPLQGWLCQFTKKRTLQFA